MDKSQSGALSLRDLSRVELDESDQADLMAELTTGTDRAAALVVSSIIDNDLARLLEMILIHRTKEQLNDLLYNPQAPLSGFSSRIKIAHAIGIIGDDVRSSLNSIRLIRNAFAHSQKPIKFTQPTISKECDKLPKTKAEDHLPGAADMSAPRLRYIAYCVTMSSIIRHEIPKTWGNRPSLWAVLRVP